MPSRWGLSSDVWRARCLPTPSVGGRDARRDKNDVARRVTSASMDEGMFYRERGQEWARVGASAYLLHAPSFRVLVAGWRVCLCAPCRIRQVGQLVRGAICVELGFSLAVLCVFGCAQVVVIELVVTMPRGLSSKILFVRRGRERL